MNWSGKYRISAATIKCGTFSLRKSVFHKKPKQPKVIPFTVITTQAPKKQEQPAYTHRCTVCGRTDVSNPELEFRYCSKCKGYYCYCGDHINNHSHIQ